MVAFALAVEGFQDSPVVFVLAGVLGAELAVFVGLGSNLLLKKRLKTRDKAMVRVNGTRLELALSWAEKKSRG